MRFFKLSDMHDGWLVGNFTPTVLCTEHAEVAVKSYKAGDMEPRHHHDIATEITVILKGIASFVNGGRVLGEGEIVRIKPGESAEFKALSDVTTLVVKVPSIPGDKYED